MHCNNLTLVLGLGLVRVSSRIRVRIRVRVKVRVSVMVRVSIRTSWVVNFALFRRYRPVIYTCPGSAIFEGLTVVTDRHADKQSTLYSVNTKHLASVAMRPNN